MDNSIAQQNKYSRVILSQTLKSAAQEILAIDTYLSENYADIRESVHFELVCAHQPREIGWDNLPEAMPGRGQIAKLLECGRIAPPRLVPDPWWRLICTVWDKVDDPFAFARYALDRALSRSIAPENAEQIFYDICERYTLGRISKPSAGQVLQVGDFASESGENLSIKLEVGREITLARMRDRQYMPRTGRLSVLHNRAEELFEQTRLGSRTGVSLFWLTGRSGSGKSVLLLQLLERLVGDGRRVAWLKGASEHLEPLLRSIADQPEELCPEFIAIDDIYDRDARTRMDLPSLGAFLDEQGSRPWPLILTCGPREFAEDFERDARFRGFEVCGEPVAPVGPEESAQVCAWYVQRTGRNPTLAQAFEQSERGNGLFVSMATELEHGDLREFAVRFADRIAIRALDGALRLPLALNRLYLRAPYEWLGREDRERLATLNAEGDFSLDPGENGQAVRLTHPHLSDAIYRAMRQPDNTLAHAHDLTEAFERTLQESNLVLSAQLLRVFSSAQIGPLAERLSIVDSDELARGCARAWKALQTSVPADGDLGADITTSWACWTATNQALSPILGTRLLEEAVGALHKASKYWPVCWLRLWTAYGGHASLLTWAEHHLPERDRLSHRQWSFVWESVFLASFSNPDSTGTWRGIALIWLSRMDIQPDWHYVWKRLVQPQLNEGQFKCDPVVACGLDRLTSNPDGPEWAFIFQDLVEITDSFKESTVHRDLLSRGWDWLDGREERQDWAYVWQALLARPNSLPAGIDETVLCSKGLSWLDGREERQDWAYVWRALLERPNALPTGIDERVLCSKGLSWLDGREERQDWTHVWQALLERPNALPTGIDERVLRSKGFSWVDGREERQEWNYVWRALLERPNALPTGIDERVLCSKGLSWLDGREERQDWTHVWQALLERPNALPAGIDERVLCSKG
ncbi:MAG: RNA-binding protein, partial [Candidatus Hydrogenedentes bacterium]|nr:RNA-binding protein [Candidatus Hydrogenedentota bacterium]